MTGRVDPLRRAILSIVVRGPLGSRTIEAIVDTGFNGYLATTADMPAALGLLHYGPVPNQDASGGITVSRGFVAEVEWLEGPIRCLAVETGLPDCLIGTSLLDERILQIDFGSAKSVEVR
jgi:predicted aspartyl protease